MGGFAVCDGNLGAPRVLPPDELEDYLSRGDIDITKKEIQDKSKGGILSKAVETGWFLLQCLARAVQHLPITELEVVTLAFATLNVVTYALWWDKPLNVECASPVPQKKPVCDPLALEGGHEIRGGGFKHAANTVITAVSQAIGQAVNAKRALLMPLVPFSRMGGTNTDEIQRGANRVPTFYTGS